MLAGMMQVHIAPEPEVDYLMRLNGNMPHVAVRIGATTSPSVVVTTQMQWLGMGRAGAVPIRLW